MASFSERIIGAAKLDPATYEEVEKDPSALGQAMAVVALSAVAAGIGAAGTGARGIAATVFASFVAWFIWAGVTFLVGTKLMPDPQTRSDFGELLRTIGFSAAPGLARVAGIIPFIGWLISLGASVWMLVAMVIAVRQALDYTSTGKAVAVCVVGFVFYLAAVFGLTMMMGLFGMAVGALRG
jgi:hypothetical protein